MLLTNKLLSGPDYDLMKLLGMILQNALVTRVDDVDLYNGPEYMTYSNVELYLLPNSPIAVQSFKATFKIRYEKGSKDKPTEPREVYIDALADRKIQFA